MIRYYDVNKLVFYGGYIPSPYIFNIDLKTNTLLTNEEVIERFGKDIDTAQQVVYQNLSDLELKTCDIADNYKGPCYFSKDADSLFWGSGEVNENADIFIDKDGSLKMLVLTYDEPIYFENDTTWLLFIDLVN